MALGNFTVQNAGLTPTQDQSVLSSNYLQWTDPNAADFSSFAQQYLPELYEQEVERFGNRTLSGFLRMVGAEMPMTSDQVIWSEQNRLHIGYDNVSKGLPGAGGETVFSVVVPAGNEVAVRVNQNIVVFDPGTGLTLKGLITVAPNPGQPNNLDFSAVCYTSADFAALGNADLKVFVYGSDFAKGTLGMEGSVSPSFTFSGS